MMNTSTTRVGLIGCLLLFVNFLANAADTQFDTLQIQQDLLVANRYVKTFKNDSALFILNPLRTIIEKHKQINSPLGLEVQLAYATVLEQEEEAALALEILLEIQEQSRLQKLWDIHVKSSLILALLHEKMERPKPTLQNLRFAQAALKKEPSIDSLYSALAIRISSWHRFYGDRDSAVFFANEVLRTAPQFNRQTDLAIGYLLMGILSRPNYTISVDYFQKAAKTYASIEDYQGQAGALVNIINLHIAAERPNLALQTNDYLFKVAQKDEVKALENHWVHFETYKTRGQIYEMLTQFDSATYYLKEGYKREVEFTRKMQNIRVAEIDAKFNDEKKSRQIERQAQAIQLERERRVLMIGFSFVVLVFAGILTYSYVQLRRANSKTKDQAERLRNLDIAKSRFFANISHELRTPLTLLLGPIKSLTKDKDLSIRQTELLHLANRNGQQIRRLIDEILDLQKLEMGKLSAHLQATPVAGFFRLYFAPFHSLGLQKKVDFKYKTAIRNDLIAKIDREKWRQIIYNLLSNAFKFTPTGGTVSAEISSKQNNLVLKVEDNGGGIPEEDIPHLFERYFQTNRPDKPAEGGMGIGLALCSEYTKLMGGEIEVKSEVGEGATFWVTIPAPFLSSSAEYQELEPSFVVEEYAGMAGEHNRDANILKSNSPLDKKPKLLVAEDNEELQKYIYSILSEKYKVEVVSNGAEALAKIESGNKFNLILSDLMMPILDGYQLLKQLKSDDKTRQIPVVMLTARADSNDKLKALRIGVDDYLVKPFDEEELLVRIQNLLANQVNREGIDSDSEDSDEAGEMAEPDRVWLATFEAFVQDNLSSGIVSVSSLAVEFAMSESTLLRHLKRLTGLTPKQYLSEIRLNMALRMLEKRTNKSIAQIASAVGYADSRSFSRSFKKRFGKLPSEV